MDAAQLAEPDSASWYVYGRLAEHHGEFEAAALAYLKVEKPAGRVSPADTYSLAQRRLAAIKKTIAVRTSAN